MLESVRVRRRAALLIVAAAASVAPLVAAPASHADAAAAMRPALVAQAAFRADPTGCYETQAVVTVEERTAGGPGAARTRAFVEVTYVVRSTCPIGDYLFYYDIHTDGSVEVPEADVEVQPGLLAASLDTVVPVFDEEAGIVLELGVKVDWISLAPAGQGTRSAWAELEVVAEYLSPAYVTNPIATDAALLMRVPVERPS